MIDIPPISVDHLENFDQKMTLNPRDWAVPDDVSDHGQRPLPCLLKGSGGRYFICSLEKIILICINKITSNINKIIRYRGILLFHKQFEYFFDF